MVADAAPDGTLLPETLRVVGRGRWYHIVRLQLTGPALWADPSPVPPGKAIRDFALQAAADFIALLDGRPPGKLELIDHSYDSGGLVLRVADLSAPVQQRVSALLAALRARDLGSVIHAWFALPNNPPPPPGSFPISADELAEVRRGIPWLQDRSFRLLHPYLFDLQDWLVDVAAHPPVPKPEP